MRQFDRVQGFGQCADLVHFHQQRIGAAFFDTFGQTGRVGDKEIIAHQLHLVANRIGQFFPTCPIIFGHAILDGQDRVISAKRLEIGHIFRRGQAEAFACQLIFAAFEIFGRRAIKRQHHIRARLEACFFNRLHDEIKRRAA